LIPRLGTIDSQGGNKMFPAWEQSVTSLETVSVTPAQEIDVNNGAIYNLQGVRVDNPVKGGLYIQNGKKIVVK